MKTINQWCLTIFALTIWSLAFACRVTASQETLVLSANPALPGSATTATVAIENVSDIETFYLELSFAAGAVLDLPTVALFSRGEYFPQRPFGTVPTVELNDLSAAVAGKKILINGFEPFETSGHIGDITFNVDYGAVSGDTHILSLSGKFFSRSEQVVKQFSSVSTTFTAGQFPNIVADPTVRLFNPVVPGSQSNPQTVLIKNTGIADLIIGNVYIRDSDAAEFSISTDLCSNQTISPGNDCTVRIVLSPNDEGIKTANLYIPCNDPDVILITPENPTPILTVPLKMTGEQFFSEIPGDINGDNRVSLADAIIALQVLTGNNSIPIADTFDMDGNGILDLVETVQIIQQAAGLR